MRQLLIALILLMLPGVSAEFLAFGEQTLTAEPCAAISTDYFIQNTNDAAANYDISVDGDASDFVGFSAIAFSIQPQETAQITGVYNIPCDAKPDTYTADIFFNDGEIEQQLTQQIIVTLPDTVNASFDTASKVITPCDTASYTLTLNNEANFTEIYKISATGHPNIHLSEENTVIEGEQDKDIILSISPTDCTQSGTFPIQLSVSAEKSSISKTFPLELIIKASDIPVLAEGISSIRTVHGDQSTKLTIKNTGDRTTSYSLTLSGIPWATLSPESVSIKAGETKEIQLRLSPDANIEEGTYKAELAAVVDSTSIKYSKILTIKLKDPTAFERNPVAVIATLFIIALLITGIIYAFKYVKSPSFKGRLQRFKAKRAARKAAREKRRQQNIQRKLEQQKKELERKQAQREQIRKQEARKLVKEFKKSFYMVARKDIISGAKRKSTVRVIAAIFAIIVLALVIALWSVIRPNLLYVGIGIAVLLIIVLAKWLARLTVIRKTWKITLAKQTLHVNAWKRGLSHLTLFTEQPIKHFRLLIKKTRAPTQPAPFTYSTFLIKTNEEAELNGTITISKAWMRRNGIALDELRLGKYNNKVWQTINITKAGETKKTISFTAPLSAGTFSIYAKTKPKPRNKLFWGLLGVALVIAIAIFLSPRTTDTPGIPPQMWQADNIHDLNLSTYFKDPDKDALNYTASKTQHITISISGDTAYFTPDSEWSGEEKVIFTADDGKGGKINSNAVPLRVKKQLVPTSAQPYIALVLAIITVAILLLSIRSQKKK